MTTDEFLFTEKYRPQSVKDCILPERMKDTFLNFIKAGKIPNLLLTGKAGVGKTTVAKALCRDLGVNYLFINSSDERGIDTLRVKIKEYASTVSLTGGQKVIILDEADYITPEAQAALRGAIEQFSSNCTFILTCNFKSKLIEAIHSRCTVIDFQLKGKETALMAAEFMKRIEFILKEEGVAYDKKVIASLIMKFFPDYRRTLNELQRLSVFGEISADTVNQIADIRNVAELFEFMKTKKFSQVRKWVVDNGDVDVSRVFRVLYDSLNDYIQPLTIPVAILIIAKYQHQAAFVADSEINMVACLTELMLECEFV